jgi:hypothetical protein
MSEIDGVLGESWGALTEIVLELMDPPKTWYTVQDDETGETTIFLGSRVAPMVVRSPAQASALQGILTYAKLAYDSDQLS